jgi:hypothetical protein
MSSKAQDSKGHEPKAPHDVEPRLKKTDTDINLPSEADTALLPEKDDKSFEVLRR